jgi:hypothetical protein
LSDRITSTRPRVSVQTWRTRWLATSVAAAAAALWALPAAAQNCETTPQAVIETFPASSSRDVPLNGLVTVAYCPSDVDLVDRTATRLLRDLGDEAGSATCECGPGAECLEVGLQTRCLEDVPAAVDVEGDVVTLQSASSLEPLTTYVVEAPEPSGTLRFSFNTGTDVDELAPEFDGVESVRIIGCGEGYASNAACPAEQDTDGFVVVLRAQAAIDEVGRVNLEYLATQVRGETRIERGRIRGDGADDVTMSVFISSSDLEGDDWELLCFEMAARDPFGRESAPTEAICEHTPEYSPFGSACAVAPGPAERGRSLPAMAGVLALLAALLGLRASSGRSRRR